MICYGHPEEARLILTQNLVWMLRLMTPHNPIGYEKVITHIITFSGESRPALTSWSENGLIEQRRETGFWFLWWLGVGHGKSSYTWFELPSDAKEGNTCAFLPAWPDVGQKGKKTGWGSKSFSTHTSRYGSDSLFLDNNTTNFKKHKYKDIEQLCLYNFIKF